MRERVLIAVVAATLSAAVTQTTSVLTLGARIDANTHELRELRQDVRELRRVLLQRSPAVVGP